MSNVLPPELLSIKAGNTFKAMGIEKYSVPTSKKVILSTSEKSRGGRKAILQSLQKAMAPHGAKYTDDGRAGFVEVRKIKIFLKPEKFAVGVVLKPSFISKDIVDKDLPFATYYKTLHSAISNHKTMTPEQKELLLAILDYHNTFSSKDYVTMKKMMGALKDAIPLSTINNDFGEILGPFAVISKKLLPVDRRTAKVFIPGRSNEPLLDYKIHDAKTVFKISAKSGESTNTLKPSDVVKLIEDEPTYRKKYGSTIQFKVLKLLSEGSWKQGPIDAINFLKSKGYKELAWLKKPVYSEDIRQKSENELVRISREKLDFTPIFLDATNSKVHYVKFRMAPDGSVEWKVAKHSEVKSGQTKPKRVVFRSKNYVGRPNGDKLGFQV